jgi:hypothetical protein
MFSPKQDLPGVRFFTTCMLQNKNTKKKNQPYTLPDPTITQLKFLYYVSTWIGAVGR